MEGHADGGGGAEVPADKGGDGVATVGFEEVRAFQ